MGPKVSRANPGLAQCVNAVSGAGGESSAGRSSAASAAECLNDEFVMCSASVYIDERAI
jgi:hypothetical protein